MQRRRDGVAVATERARDVERLGERVDAPSNRVVVLLARDRVEQIARGRARRDGASTLYPRARDDARRRDGDSRRIAPRRRTPCRRATEWRRATERRPRGATRGARLRPRARATRRATRPGRARDATSATGDEVFVFGLGYLGRALARALTREGYVVRGTTLDDGEDDEDDGGAETTTTWRGTRGDVEAIEAMVERATYVISTVPPARAETGEGWRDPVYDAFARTLSAARRGRSGTTKDAVRGVLQHDRGVRRSRGTMGG